MRGPGSYHQYLKRQEGKKEERKRGKGKEREEEENEKKERKWDRKRKKSRRKKRRRDLIWLIVLVHGFCLFVCFSLKIRNQRAGV